MSELILPPYRSGESLSKPTIPPKNGDLTVPEYQAGPSLKQRDRTMMDEVKGVG
jgi:hypothetical protein